MLILHLLRNKLWSSVEKEIKVSWSLRIKKPVVSSWLSECLSTCLLKRYSGWRLRKSVTLIQQADYEYSRYNLVAFIQAGFKRIDTLCKEDGILFQFDFELNIETSTLPGISSSPICFTGSDLLEFIFFNIKHSSNKSLHIRIYLYTHMHTHVGCLYMLIYIYTYTCFLYIGFLIVLSLPRLLTNHHVTVTQLTCWALK